MRTDRGVVVVVDLVVVSVVVAAVVVSEDGV